MVNHHVADDVHTIDVEIGVLLGSPNSPLNSGHLPILQKSPFARAIQTVNGSLAMLRGLLGLYDLCHATATAMQNSLGAVLKYIKIKLRGAQQGQPNGRWPR